MKTVIEQIQEELRPLKMIRVTDSDEDDTLVYYNAEDVDRILSEKLEGNQFTLEQENAIWGVTQYLSKEHFRNPFRIYKRQEVFDLIKSEINWDE